MLQLAVVAMEGIHSRQSTTILSKPGVVELVSVVAAVADRTVKAEQLHTCRLRAQLKDLAKVHPLRNSQRIADQIFSRAALLTVAVQLLMDRHRKLRPYPMTASHLRDPHPMTVELTLWRSATGTMLIAHLAIRVESVRQRVKHEMASATVSVVPHTPKSQDALEDRERATVLPEPMTATAGADSAVEVAMAMIEEATVVSGEATVVSGEHTGLVAAILEDRNMVGKAMSIHILGLDREVGQGIPVRIRGSGGGVVREDGGSGEEARLLGGGRKKSDLHMWMGARSASGSARECGALCE